MSADRRSHENHAPQLEELLESYRPAIDDLADEAWQELREALARDPEVQHRVEMIQRQDYLVRSAMHDVPVPAGLAERLLAGLESGQADDVLNAAPTPETPATVALPERPRMGRRAWLGVAAAAVVAIVAGVWPRTQRPAPQLEPGDLAEHLKSWLADPELRNGANWETIAAGTQLPAKDISDLNDKIAVRRRSTRLGTNLGSAVVYDLNYQGTSATLYVVQTPWDCYVAKSPYTPLPGLTGSRTAGAWQRGKTLYVLVVNPREADLRDFVRVLVTA